MSWSDFYLFCFLVGFSLSLVSFLAGAVHIHLPVKWHLPVHLGQQPAGGAHAPGMHVPWFNASTAMSFLAWFGGAGFILTRESSLLGIPVLALALVAGLFAAWLVLKFMVKLMRDPGSPMKAEDYRLEGAVGMVSMPIRENGTGEVIFSLGGTRRCAGARTEGGKAIEKGTEIVIERYEKGIAYVKPWDEFVA